MDNDCLVVIYKTTFPNQNYSIRKLHKLMTSYDCHQTTLFHLITDISITYV